MKASSWGRAGGLGVVLAVVALWYSQEIPVRAAAPQEGGTLRPGRVRCEYQDAPLGLDAAQPHFGWWCEAPDPRQRGLRQTAFQILVAASEAPLEQEQGDLWDSGKVASDQSAHVAYAGRGLPSGQRCFWKVRIWDQNDRASPWSQPASFTMGLLDAADWTARWIGAKLAESVSLRDDVWVWCGEPDARRMYPPGTRYFRKRFVLPAGAEVAEATVVMAGDNSFTLSVNGHRALEGNGWESAFRADVRRWLVSGDNVLAVAATNGGTGPNEAGVIGRLAVRLTDGSVLTVPVDASWKTADHAPPGWETAAFDDAAWAAVHVLGPYGMAPWGQVASVAAALPLLRREFEITKPIQRATAFVCGLGQYELHLNGHRVGDRQLDPGWTNYRRTCLYSTYEVTSQLTPGRNAVGVLLGNGMYNVTGGRYIKFKGSFGPPKLILQLVVEHPDGTATVIATDPAWKATAGPIRFSCIYGGEDYDARQEPRGWTKAGFDDAVWSAAEVVDGPGGVLRSQLAPPLKVIRELPAVEVTQPKPGVFVYDLGRNFSGWPHVTVRGPAGAVVKLIPGERLEPSGLVSQRSSGGPVWFSYTLRGDPQETWQPRFSYYGFRYVQVEGAVPEGTADAPAELPRVVALRGAFLSNSADVVGEFACSNPLVNRIHDLINAAIRSNLQSVLTDCPHREKLGWLEVSHLLARGIMYNYDVPRFYAKVSQDMQEAQLDNGLVPDIAPEFTVFSGGFRDSPEWGSACVYNPWHVYQMYGDRRLFEQQYDVMRRYVEYLGSTAKGHVVAHGLGDWYDIGPRGPGESQLTSKGVTATAIYYGDLMILAEAARLLGKPEDAQRYAGRAAEVRAAFHARFFQPDQDAYDRGSQTAQAMPLVLGLVPDDRRAAVLAKLVQAVQANGHRVTAGDVGFMYVVRALSDADRGDVLYGMVTQADGPGYAYQLAQGATTLTEAWDSNPGSSQNHCMLGHAEEWFYRGLAGIAPDPAGPGFKQFLLQPQVVGDVTWVRSHYDSVHGRIISHWQVADGRLVWDLTVPPNTTATIAIPTQDAAGVTEGGRPAADAVGVKFVGAGQGRGVYQVTSGSYRFVAPHGD